MKRLNMYNIKYFVLLILCQIQCHQCLVEVQKVICTTYDKNFSRFDLCELKSSKQKMPTISLKIKMLQLPVTNCHVNLELIFISSKFSSSVFNSTWDACHFMKNTRRYRSLLRFYNFISNFTNLNHSCPYNHDIEVINFQTGNLYVPIPAPKGDYLMRTQFLIDKKLRLAVDYKAKHS